MALLSEDAYLTQALDAARANSAWQAQQAEINRQWETQMSNTAHQREVADLAAAGLNPLLSANSGARWGTVGNATADTTSSQALANMATTIMNNRAMVQAAGISAGAQIAAAQIAANASMQNNQAQVAKSIISNPATVIASIFGDVLNSATGASKWSEDLTFQQATKYLENLY